MKVRNKTLCAITLQETLIKVLSLNILKNEYFGNRCIMAQKYHNDYQLYLRVIMLNDNRLIALM